MHTHIKYTEQQRRSKLWRKWKLYKTYGSVAKKTGKKICGRTEGDRGDEPDTATPMVGK